MKHYVESYIDAHQLRYKNIYLAVSGGVDSMVMCTVFMALNVEYTILHCNFKLRGKESDADEQLVLDFAAKHNIDVKVKTFETKKYCESNKMTIQEGARQLRYDWFKTFLRTNNDVLCTAHHLDDQIETFFINFLRGTGIKGLSGINDQNLIKRPLQNIEKAVLIDYAKKNNVPYRLDKSNTTDHYLRNRLRHFLIPELKKETTGFYKKSLQLLDELKAVDGYLDELVEPFKTTLKKERQIKIDSIKDLKSILIPRLFESYGVNRKKLNAFVKFLNSSTGSVFDTDSHRFLNDRGWLHVQELTKDRATIPEMIINDIPNHIITKDFSFNLYYEQSIDAPIFENHKCYLDAEKIKPPLTIRQWKKGDKIQPFGMKGKKLVSDELKDHKINKFKKDQQLVVVSNNDEVVWIVGLTVSNRYALTSHTQQRLIIEHIK
jgi:tRNA(Ile)-lysidine synthase